LGILKTILTCTGASQKTTASTSSNGRSSSGTNHSFEFFLGHIATRNNQCKKATVVKAAFDYCLALILLLAGCSPAEPASSSD